VQYIVEGTTETGFVADLVPEVAQELSWGALISKQHVEDEVDLMLRAVRGFWQMEPDQVMRMASAMSARATELAVHLHRLEGKREWRQVRTMQVDKLLQELERQFRIASRLLEVRRQDLETAR
jgi:hypothetical protein